MRPRFQDSDRVPALVAVRVAVYRRQTAHRRVKVQGRDAWRSLSTVVDAAHHVERIDVRSDARTLETRYSSRQSNPPAPAQNRNPAGPETIHYQAAQHPYGKSDWHSTSVVAFPARSDCLSNPRGITDSDTSCGLRRDRPVVHREPSDASVLDLRCSG